MIDIRSGQVIEFFDQEIEDLKEALARKLGFRLVGHKLNLYGIPLSEPMNS